MDIAGSDSHAFTLMRGRLGEIRSVIFLCKLAKSNPNLFSKFTECDYLIEGGYPNWSLLRSMMPILESVGDLLYSSNSSKNLNLGFKELSKYNGNYSKLSTILASLYRHSLMHQDELRVLKVNGGRTIGWQLSYGMELDHLEYEVDEDKNLLLKFELDQFLDDLSLLLSDLIVKADNGDFKSKVKEKYNSWTVLDINYPGNVQVKASAIQIEYDKLILDHK